MISNKLENERIVNKPDYFRGEEQATDILTEADLEEGCFNLFELKVHGLITDDEEYRRKELILQYMEYQSGDDEDDQQSLTIIQMLSTVRHAFRDCFAHSTSLICPRERI
jgi:predicted nucleic acid-binding protein